jgi:hypothetical protein
MLNFFWSERRRRRLVTLKESHDWPERRMNGHTPWLTCRTAHPDSVSGAVSLESSAFGGR